MFAKMTFSEREKQIIELLETEEGQKVLGQHMADVMSGKFYQERLEEKQKELEKMIERFARKHLTHLEVRNNGSWTETTEIEPSKKAMKDLYAIVEAVRNGS